MNSKLSTPFDRRKFLSAAVAVGSIAGLSMLVNPSGKAYAASLNGTYGVDTPMQTFPAGKGIIKTYKNAFSSKYVEKATFFTGADGRLKIAYSVIGLVSQFQVADVATGRNEFVGTPPSRLNSGITSLKFNPKDGYIYSTMSGTVSQFNPATKTFKSLGEATSASTTAYGPAFDASGNAWFGSFPDAGVGRFAPGTGAKTSFASVDAKSQYVRSIAVLGDTVYAGTGAIAPKIVSFPVANPSLVKTITVPGISAEGFVFNVAAHGGRIFAFYETSTLVSKCSVYNPSVGAWADFKYNPFAREMVSLPGDSWVYFVAKTYPEARNSIVRWHSGTGIYETVAAAPIIPKSLNIRSTTTGNFLDLLGEDSASGATKVYSVALKDGSVATSATIDVIPASYKVQDFIASADGKLYVGGYRADGIATISLATDARWRSEGNSPIHQIEGMIEYGTDRIYVGSYGSGDLIRFNKSDGSAKLIKKLRTDYMQSRPYAWAIAAGKVVSGTVPEYGLRGGALTIIDPATDTVETVLNKYIPEQSIVGLVGSGDIVYGTTSVKGGYGIADDTAPATVFAHNVRTGVQLWKNTSLTYETEIHSPVIAKGRLFVGVANGIIELNINTGATLRTWKLFKRVNTTGYRNVRLAYHPQTNRLIHCGGGTLTAVGLANDSRSLLYQGSGGTMDITPAGKIYMVTGNSMDISEIDSVYSPSIASQSDLVGLAPDGSVYLRRSNGAGAYGSAFTLLSEGYADAKSIHIADWNGNGIFDLVSTHKDGSLKVRYGKAEGGFEAPVILSSSGWTNRRITVARWSYGTYRPAILSIDIAGDLYVWQASSTFTLETPQKLGSGWKAEQFSVLDKNYDNTPGLLIKEGANLYWYPKATVMNASSARETLKLGGLSGMTQFTVVNKHRYGYNGIVWKDTTDTLRYMSNVSGSMSGILNYGITWFDYRLGGASW